MSKRLLTGFSKWFSSAAGVWQTTIIVLAVVVVECANRSLDPHAFILMAVLTVYSAVTQPMLAYANDLAAQRLERLEQRILADVEPNASSRTESTD